MIRRLLRIGAFCSLAALSSAAVCPPRLLKAFDRAKEEGIPTEAVLDDYAKAIESTASLRDVTFRQASERFADDVLAAFDNPAPGIPEPAFERTIAKFVHLLAGPADGRYSAEHLRRAMIAVDGLRTNGVLYAGLAERVATRRSSSWLVNVNNRGHLF